MKKVLVILFLFRSIAAISQINSSGTNTVSIPIYNLTEGNVSIPISLDYDGSGIQVGSSANRVGQNWNLNAGGKITRTVKDKPDELNFNAFQTSTEWPMHGKYFVNPEKSVDIIVNSEKFINFQDLENDIFNLNINGKSISFIIDQPTIPSNNDCYKFNNNIKLLNDTEDVKIEFMEYVYSPENSGKRCEGISDPFNKLLLAKSADAWSIERALIDGDNFMHSTIIQYFRVTMPDGSQYYFGESERDREYSFTGNDISKIILTPTEGRIGTAISIYPISWVLTRIILPSDNENIAKGPNVSTKRQEIRFKYDREIEFVDFIKYSRPYIATGGYDIPFQSVESELYNKPIIYGSTLKSIESTNFFLEFNSNEIFTLKNSMSADINMLEFDNTERLDINNQIITDYFSPERKLTKLKNILIKDKISNKKKGYYLDHSYFQTYKWNEPNQIVNQQGRLKLDGIYEIEFSSVPSLIFGHRFSYIDGLLPETTTFARDHWGFYNGQDNNSAKTGLIEVPTDELIAKFYGVTPTQSTEESSDLTPNFAFSKIGILNKIEKNGVSSLEFIYEAHKCDNYFESLIPNSTLRGQRKEVGGLRLKEVIHTDFITFNKEIKKYTYLKGTTNISSGEIALWPTYYFKEDAVNILYCIPNLFSGISSRIQRSNYINYTEIKEEIIGVAKNDTKSNGYKILEFHGYNFTPENSPFQISSNLVSNTWVNEGSTESIGGLVYSRYRDYKVMPPIGNPQVGNLKSEKVFTPNNFLISKIDYSYTSSEPIQSKSQYFFTYPFTTCSKKAIGSVKSNNFSESPVAHEGLNLSSIINIARIGFYTIKPSLSNNSSRNVSLAFQILTAVNSIIEFININNETIDCSIYNAIPYSLPFYKFRPLEQVKTIYDVNETNPLVTKTTSYFESSNKHNGVIETKTEISNSNSALSVVKNFIMYNKDFIIPAGTTDPISLGIKALNDRNMLVPIETYTVKDGKVIGGTINHYYSDVSKEGFVKKTYSLELAKPINLDAFTPSLVDPSSGVFTTDPNYRVTAKFNSYNERGLVTEIENVKEFKENTNTPGVEFIQSKTTIGYTHNNLIKSSVTTQGLGSDTRTTTYESIPLFGETRRILPNNDVVKTEYDDLGRVKLIRDKDENILKSYIYNDKIPSSSLSFSINNGTETLLTLEDVGSYEKTILAGQTSLALKSDLIGFGAKSVQLKFTNPAGVTTTVNSSNTTQSIFYSDISNQTWNIGGYYVEVLAYRGENNQGDIVGRRKIFFTIVDSTINQQRTIKPKN